MQRAHSTFRTAAGLSLSGQAVEAAIVRRACLESTLYGVSIKLDPKLLELWLRRNDDETSKRAQKRAFQNANLLPVLRSVDPKMSEVWSFHYEEAIEFGAHPNPMGILSSARWAEDGVKQELQVTYLHGDAPLLWFAMRSTAHVGLASLLIFYHMAEGVFLNTGVREKTLGLRSVVDAMFKEKRGTRAVPCKE